MLITSIRTDIAPTADHIASFPVAAIALSCIIGFTSIRTATAIANNDPIPFVILVVSVLDNHLVIANIVHIRASITAKALYIASGSVMVATLTRAFATILTASAIATSPSKPLVIVLDVLVD